MARINFIDKSDSTGGMYDNDPKQLTANNINEIKNAVNSISVPSKTSELTNDSNFLTTVSSDSVKTALGISDEGSLSKYLTEQGTFAELPTQPDVSNFITKDVDNLTNYTKTTDLSEVAKSGNYSDLTGAPMVPTKVSQLQNDSNFLTTVSSDSVKTALGISAGGSASKYLTELLLKFRKHQTLLILLQKMWIISLITQKQQICLQSQSLEIIQI